MRTICRINCPTFGAELGSGIADEYSHGSSKSRTFITASMPADPGPDDSLSLDGQEKYSSVYSHAHIKLSRLLCRRNIVQHFSVHRCNLTEYQYELIPRAYGRYNRDIRNIEILMNLKI